MKRYVMITQELREHVVKICNNNLDEYARLLKAGLVLSEEQLEDCRLSRQILEEVR